RPRGRRGGVHAVAVGGAVVDRPVGRPRRAGGRGRRSGAPDRVEHAGRVGGGGRAVAGRARGQRQQGRRGRGQAPRAPLVPWPAVSSRAVAVLAVALAVRLPLLAGGQTDYDEGVYWQSLRALAAGHPLFSSVYSSQPPAFLMLLL